MVLLRRFAGESPKNPARRADVPGLLLGVTMLAALTASLRVPLLVATAGYLIAVALACVIRSDR